MTKFKLFICSGFWFLVLTSGLAMRPLDCGTIPRSTNMSNWRYEPWPVQFDLSIQANDETYLSFELMSAIYFVTCQSQCKPIFACFVLTSLFIYGSAGSACTGRHSKRWRKKRGGFWRSSGVWAMTIDPLNTPGLRYFATNRIFWSCDIQMQCLLDVFLVPPGQKYFWLQSYISRL